MKIIDEMGNPIQTADPATGRLVQERRFVAHHEARPEQQEQSHHEVTERFANGGQLVQKVIDVPYQAAQKAWDEYEDVLVYRPFTQAEVAQMQIEQLKENLNQTDYITAKAIDRAVSAGSITELLQVFSAIRVEYLDTFAQREAWRSSIRELEKSI